MHKAENWKNRTHFLFYIKRPCNLHAFFFHLLSLYHLYMQSHTESTNQFRNRATFLIGKCKEPLHRVSEISDESRQIKQITITFQPFQLLPELIILLWILNVEVVHVPAFHLLFQARRAEQSLRLQQICLQIKRERSSRVLIPVTE